MQSSAHNSNPKRAGEPVVKRMGVFGGWKRGGGSWRVVLGSRRTLMSVAGAAAIAAGLWVVFGDGDATKRVSSVEELRAYFRSQDYSAAVLTERDARVPPLYFARIPAEWADGLTVDEKKNLFFRALLPLVLRANREIRADRTRLAELRGELSAGRDLARHDRAWLRALALRYEAVSEDDTESTLTSTQLATLTARVDIIPPSLALAQAAVESAYATSRFAVEGNALYGQWRFGSGLRPGEQRTELGDYRIAAFDTPLDSVRAYMRNLNTNPAYRTLRTIRGDARRRGSVPISGLTLAAGLGAYSEKGTAYIGLLRELIRVNKLWTLDSARLHDRPPVRIVPGAI
jgi:Bax protein